MLYPNISKPLHEQLKEIILNKIRLEELKPGDALPGERKLAQMYNVSRVTVRRVISDLAADNILSKQHGKDTIVCDYHKGAAIQNTLGRLYGVVEELLLKNKVIDVEVLFLGFEPASSLVRENLRLGEFERTMFCFHRRVELDGQPLLVNYSYASENIGCLLQALDMKRDLVYSYLERNGYDITHANQIVSAGIADKHTAELLSLRQSAPVLEVTRTTYVKGGFPIMFEKSAYRTDKYQYFVKLERTKI